jgi:hypothetical protein
MKLEKFLCVSLFLNRHVKFLKNTEYFVFALQHFHNSANMGFRAPKSLRTPPKPIFFIVNNILTVFCHDKGTEIGFYSKKSGKI